MKQAVTMMKSAAGAWDRTPGVDDVHARLAEMVQAGDASALLLGDAQDQTPLIAVGRPVAGAPKLLLIGAGAGDSVISVPVCAELLGAAPEIFDGWEVWAICALDLARLRLNDGVLRAARPSTADHAAARRMAWGPGEDPERNLPLAAGLLYQPDRAPEGVTMPSDWVPCSPEALALARAVTHLRPQLTVSLREVPSGGVSFSCSQELPEQDTQTLIDALTQGTLVVHQAAKQRDGRQIHGQAGLVVLPSLPEEQARLRASDEQADERRHTGGVGVWQLLSDLDADTVYLACDLPRFTHADFDVVTEGDAARDVVVTVEDRDRRGKPTPTRIVRLHRPGHPAHEAELRVEAAKDGEAAEGRHDGVPAASGWLAVEAHLQRRHVLRSALAAFEEALPQFATSDHVRAMQLLRDAAEGHDKLIASYQANKRYGRRATAAEVMHWTASFSLGTALMLTEAKRALEHENAADLKIKKLAGLLDELLDAELAQTQPLRPVAVSVTAQSMAAFAAEAARLVAAGGPARIRQAEREADAERLLADARKRARQLKQLKRPRAERAEADGAVTDAEAHLAAVRAQAAAPVRTPADEQEAEAVTEAAPVEPGSQDDEPAVADGADAQTVPQDRHLTLNVARKVGGRPEGPELTVPAEEQAPAAAPAEDADLPGPNAEVSESGPDSEPEHDDLPGLLPGPEADQPEAAETFEFAADADTSEGQDEPADEPQDQPDSGDLGVPAAPAPADAEPVLVPAETPAAPAWEPEAPREVISLSDPATDPASEIPEPFTEPPAPVPAPDTPAEPAPAVDPQTPEDTPDAEDDSAGEPAGDQDEDPVAEEPEPLSDLERRLPDQLRLPSEWGRGPIHWDEQIPRSQDPPPFRRLVEDVAQIPSDQTDTDPDTEWADAEPQEPEAPSVQIEVAARSEIIGDVRGAAVGFRRSRVDLQARQPEPIPVLAAPAPTGGRFERRRRRI